MRGQASYERAMIEGATERTVRRPYSTHPFYSFRWPRFEWSEPQYIERRVYHPGTGMVVDMRIPYGGGYMYAFVRREDVDGKVYHIKTHVCTVGERRITTTSGTFRWDERRKKWVAIRCPARWELLYPPPEGAQ